MCRSRAPAPSGALTRFKPAAKTDLPATSEVDDAAWLPGRGWAMLGGEVFEDDKRLVVRLEVPGMAKEDLDIEVLDDALVVQGEKRFEKEDTGGPLARHAVRLRRIPPRRAAAGVGEGGEAASARYKNGVLRIELPKASPGKPKVVAIKVE